MKRLALYSTMELSTAFVSHHAVFCYLYYVVSEDSSEGQRSDDQKMGKQNKMLAVSTLSTVHEEFGG
jgi:hypothetical protein